MSRKTAREVAMKLAFAALLGGEDTYDAVLDKSDIDEHPTPDDIEYSKAILDGILLHCDEIDTLIHELAIGWKLERMPKVDLSILRVAIYEMMYRKDIPCSVSINEAVELAKQFGGDRSSAYINGMLGTLAKRLSEKQEG
ncbi:MAG TPA: transcription antitermination factor NusB [Clostridia bacterium]|nr:transcription antitermination factor NusB [Clostridia bacterium]